jgi:hypothetical protein
LTARYPIYLSGCLEQTQLVPQLLLGNGARCINLVTQNEERHTRELLHGDYAEKFREPTTFAYDFTRLTKGIQFGLAFRESFGVRSINQEDDTIDLGEVVSPQSSS